ncbi:MAG: hypothetical protein Unbinned8472contig1000_49 [Prokaryotic dsDNA virus sp.]|nr:MAG: hypothetical protein Unbinned8472contig1000_49 [Prokaryotic dsDNA virus sp.]|tara:strand:+ start:53527 stop:53796 length:270 start_codon:yes stop_codon:yes gene_type:complete
MKTYQVEFTIYELLPQYYHCNDPEGVDFDKLFIEVEINNPTTEDELLYLLYSKPIPFEEWYIEAIDVGGEYVGDTIREVIEHVQQLEKG